MKAWVRVLAAEKQSEDGVHALAVRLLSITSAQEILITSARTEAVS